MRRSRYKYETVETVNGFDIDRETIGSCTYWHAIKSDAEGYTLASYRDLGYKRDAIAKAQAHGG